ncbi:MAG: FAD-dependent thymidylate synthase [Coriobacteriia bacterium]|nr:FAD-dependent thymidylate synthase [Coriobacteriia bacterium]
MRVNLLFSTPDPERAIAAAARLCYAPVGGAELLDSMSDEEVEKILKILLTSGHLSALEHASYTFAIDGVSRAMTHQLVRHRLASYNQQSQRYVRYEDEPEFIIPPQVRAVGGEVEESYVRHCKSSFESYRDLIDKGVAAEDARYLLPNAMETKIVVTMNMRELLHFFGLRCCRRAQWEIRTIANRMLELVLPTAPYIFADAGAACRRTFCPEGSMTCGIPFPRVDRSEL